MSQVVLILTTWPDKSAAEQAAKNWVNKKLAACVNILPQMRSIYHWDGKTHSSTEHQLLIKTTHNNSEALKQAILEEHPYECPEILILPINGGHQDYLNWITGYVQ
jgi:periplasmic divalent cation tolerance protein